MLSKIIQSVNNWLKNYQADILLVIGAMLISLLSFALGYIVAKEEKEPIRIEETRTTSSSSLG